MPLLSHIVFIGPNGGFYHYNAKTGERLYMTESAALKFAKSFTNGKFVRISKTKKRITKSKGQRIGSKTIVGETHVKAWSSKENRMYEHVLQSELQRGTPERVARQIAAATVNKYRSAHGLTRATKKR